MKKEKDDFSRAAWVRQTVLKRPEITLEQLQTEYDRSSARPKNKRPEAIQVIYQARSELAKRWGVDDIKLLPRNKQKKIVTAAMIRLFLAKFGADAVFSKAEPYFVADGLSITSGQYSMARTAFVEAQAEAADNKSMTDGNIQVGDDDSPDPNQNTGPRARKKAPQGRKKGRKNRDGTPDRRFSRSKGKGGNANGLDYLFKLKQCVSEAGGFAETREALKVLEKLQDLPT